MKCEIIAREFIERKGCYACVLCKDFKSMAVESSDDTGQIEGDASQQHEKT